MAKYANRTCTRCGLRRPQPNMKQTKKSQYVGTSFGLYNISKGSTRKKSVRGHVRHRNVWVCKHRDACNDPDYYARLARQRAAFIREVEQSYGEIDGAIKACDAHVEDILNSIDLIAKSELGTKERKSAVEKAKNLKEILIKEADAAEEEINRWSGKDVPEKLKKRLKEAQSTQKRLAKESEHLVEALDLLSGSNIDKFLGLIESGSLVRKYMDSTPSLKDDIPETETAILEFSEYTGTIVNLEEDIEKAPERLQAALNSAVKHGKELVKQAVKLDPAQDPIQYVESAGKAILNDRNVRDVAAAVHEAQIAVEQVFENQSSDTVKNARSKVHSLRSTLGRIRRLNESKTEFLETETARTKWIVEAGEMEQQRATHVIKLSKKLRLTGLLGRVIKKTPDASDNNLGGLPKSMVPEGLNSPPQTEAYQALDAHYGQASSLIQMFAVSRGIARAVITLLDPLPPRLLGWLALAVCLLINPAQNGLPIALTSAITAIVLGHEARRKANEQVIGSGKKPAIFALWFGYLGLVLTAITTFTSG